MDYRKARVVHLISLSKIEEFYYKRKQISKEEADALVKAYIERKHKKKQSIEEEKR